MAPANDGGSAITGYQIWWDSGTGEAMSIHTANYEGGTPFIATGCTLGTLYQFSIAAINSVGTSIQSSTLSIPAATVPASPTALTKDDMNTNTT